MPVTATTFYRRPLPDSCIEFASQQGKQLFTEALVAGDANIYFKLSSQFRTQDEPAYCGLSTMVMVLNALEVDPGQVWKGPWRFYHETMLDCCVPIESIKRTGLTLPEVACLARCNRLNAEAIHAEATDEYLASFRTDVVDSVRSEERVLVVSYDRSVLGQTGAGHFSPVAAYHRQTDKVLILDVARFKYPPHWVDLALLRLAMCTIDKATAKNRGYMTLSLQRNTQPLLAFGLRASIASHENEFATSLDSWRKFLEEPQLPVKLEETNLCCLRFSQYFSSFALCCKTSKNGGTKCKDQSICTLESCLSEAVQGMYAELRSTTPAKLMHSSATAILLFAFPFEDPHSDRARDLKKLMDEERLSFSMETTNEVALLRQQIQVIMKSCRLPIVI